MKMSFSRNILKKANAFRKQNWSAPSIFFSFLFFCMIIIFSFEALGLSNKDINLINRDLELKAKGIVEEYSNYKFDTKETETLKIKINTLKKKIKYDVLQGNLIFENYLRLIDNDQDEKIKKSLVAKIKVEKQNEIVSTILKGAIRQEKYLNRLLSEEKIKAKFEENEKLRTSRKSILNGMKGEIEENFEIKVFTRILK